MKKNNLKICSFTGADDQTDPAELRDIQQEYPLTEWGILIVPRLEGMPEYPTRKWIDKFLDVAGHGKTALHLCENVVHSFVRQDRDVWSLALEFDRVQLNIFENRDPANIPQLCQTARDFEQAGGGPIILPSNPWNKKLVEETHKYKEFDYLFDRSGGTGQTPDGWPTPHKDHFCGYAGGIGPHNIDEQLTSTFGAAAGSHYWIDMQKHVRDEHDNFSLTKVRQVAMAVKDFVIGSPPSRG